MMLSLDGNYIGHLGYSSVNTSDINAEADSIMKGDKNALPGIMSFAMKSLFDFGISTLVYQLHGGV